MGTEEDIYYGIIAKYCRLFDPKVALPELCSSHLISLDDVEIISKKETGPARFLAWLKTLQEKVLNQTRLVIKLACILRRHSPKLSQQLYCAVQAKHNGLLLEGSVEYVKRLLIEFYERECVLPYDPLNPKTCWDLLDHLWVDCYLTESALHSPLPPVQLLSILQQNDTRAVLVQGLPGSGKTALLKWVCMQWMSTGQLKNFHLVLFGELGSGISSAGTLDPLELVVQWLQKKLGFLYSSLAEQLHALLSTGHLKVLVVLDSKLESEGADISSVLANLSAEENVKLLITQRQFSAAVKQRLALNEKLFFLKGISWHHHRKFWKKYLKYWEKKLKTNEVLSRVVLNSVRQVELQWHGAVSVPLMSIFLLELSLRQTPEKETLLQMYSRVSKYVCSSSSDLLHFLDEHGGQETVV